jgi:hypothetical protein
MIVSFALGFVNLAIVLPLLHFVSAELDRDTPHGAVYTLRRQAKLRQVNQEYKISNPSPPAVRHFKRCC